MGLDIKLHNEQSHQRKLIIGDAFKRKCKGKCKCKFWTADFDFWILGHAPEVTHRVGYVWFGPCAGSKPPGGLLPGYIAAIFWVGYF